MEDESMEKMTGKISEDKQRVCITMPTEMWSSVQQAAAQSGVTASAFCNFVIGQYMAQHQAMMDRFMNMNPEELAKFMALLKA